MDELPEARENLVQEANITANLPDHNNLLKPIAILYEDAERTHVGGLVYPLMRGTDVFALNE